MEIAEEQADDVITGAREIGSQFADICAGNAPVSGQLPGLTSGGHSYWTTVPGRW